MENEKPKVVTIKKACELIGCSRTTFNDNHSKQLTKYYKPNGRSVIYKLEDLEKLIKKINEKKSNVITDFEIVK